MTPLQDIIRSSKSEEIGFIITDVSEYRDHAGIWGFEILTNKWLYLARFNFCSEADADQAASEFCRIMQRISSIKRASEIPCLDPALTTSRLREQPIAPLAGSAWPLVTAIDVMG